MIFLQKTVGATLSTTVTTATHVEVFPQASVTVKVTLFAPTSEQLKVNLLAVNVIVLQPSLLPPSIIEGVIVTVPWAFNSTVIDLQTAIGFVLSTTLIIWAAVVILPDASFAVQVLVIEYEPAQLPWVLTSTKVKVTLPHKSLAVAWVNTGIAGQSMVLSAGKAAITGGVVSITLMVIVAVSQLPEPSISHTL